MTLDEPGSTHLDLDALADALAGEQHPHLTGCASCTSRLAELEAAEARVVATLRALPAPTVPDDLAARLNAAFAAEPPLGAAEPAPAPVTAAAAAAAGNVTALPERTSRRRFLPAAAAAVLLVSGGGLGYALVTGTETGSGDDSASLAAGDAVPESASLLTSSSGTDYADAAAVGAVLPAVLTGGATADTALSMAAAPSVAGGAAPDPSEQARTNADAPAAAAADPLARLRTPGGLEDCLSAVLPPEEPDLRPSALDYATYQGQAALAIVLADPDPAKLSVYVVGADCAAADAKVLSFLRVDAP